MTIPHLETRRLLLRPLELADADQVQQLFPHWDIVKHMNAAIPWPYPADGARQFFRDVALPAMERGDQWSWTIRLKARPDQVIGSIGLMKGEHENRGFWLGLPWHGQGLMSEASEAVTDFWFNTLKCPVLRVPKAIANTASRRISEKQGMRVVAVVERAYVCGRMPAEIWEITAAEWRARRRRETEATEGTGSHGATKERWRTETNSENRGGSTVGPRSGPMNAIESDRKHERARARTV